MAKDNSLTTIYVTQTFKMPAPNKDEKCINIQLSILVFSDTGDSYEGLCSYFSGTYISYSPEHPISMNPFAVTREEYEQNFGEKKNFLKSLIFLIFKGNAIPSKIEDTIIDRSITEYYEEYFHPFNEFTSEERDDLRQKLLVAAKMSEDFDSYENSMEELEREIAIPPAKGDDSRLPVAESHRQKLLRQCRALYAVSIDAAATEAERNTAENKLREYKKALIENKKLVRIERQIDHIHVLLAAVNRRSKVLLLRWRCYVLLSLIAQSAIVDWRNPH